jgi:hypothetical protein
MLAIAGLAIAVAGARMFLGTGHAVKACSHQAAAVCLQGFVLLDATQLLGGAIAWAGTGLIVTAIVVGPALAAGLASSAVRLVRAAPISPGPRSSTLPSHLHLHGRVRWGHGHHPRPADNTGTRR